jgi:2-haloacid dehalogenase
MVTQAVLFDTFGTVVDWRSGVTRDVDTFATRKGLSLEAERFALDWRARYQPAMEEVRSGRRSFVSLDQLHLENLHATLIAHGVSVDALQPAELDWLNGCWHRLDAWGDSVAGLTALKARTIVGSLSNGSVSLLVRMAKYAGLPWDVVIGSDLSRSYKPDPQAYRFAADLLDLQPAEVLLCAAHNSDLTAARDVGFRTAFVPRPEEYGPAQDTDLSADSDWDFVARDLVDLASQLAP